MPVVLDASVAMAWYLREVNSSLAEETLEAVLSRRERFLVPELFYFEIFSVMTRKHPNPVSFLKTDLPFILDLPLERAAFTASIAEAALPFTRMGLSGYDAAYAALARMVHGPWLTLDTRAARLLGSPGWIISRL